MGHFGLESPQLERTLFTAKLSGGPLDLKRWARQHLTQSNRFSDQDPESLRGGVNSPGSVRGLEVPLEVQILPGAFLDLRGCPEGTGKMFTSGE